MLPRSSLSVLYVHRRRDVDVLFHIHRHQNGMKMPEMMQYRIDEASRGWIYDLAGKISP